MSNNENNETILFDCSRGCTSKTDAETGEVNVTYHPGCCKLKDYNWLSGVQQLEYKDLFEVRFKNTRKGIYVNASGQNVKVGDMVIVEATTGHDLGIVTLEGPIVGRQMRCRGISQSPAELKKIYRKARQMDILKWQEAIAREQETMVKSRRIAAELGLDMKIGDVEFQGDGSKAIFYYIADGRVDFRQLIKVFAEEFRIRIEMKQIGARQEAGLIGGLGICGRELCCANYITSFQSITTSAARCQDLSLNPQKLAGQCGKLKCCLNYEVANYLDAHSRIPRVSEPLEFQDGQAYLMKTDILRELMYFSYDKSSLSNLYALDAAEVREIIKMNRNGIKPESLQDEPEPNIPEFVTAVGDDSISRFDNIGRKKNKHRRDKSQGKSRGERQQAAAQSPADAKSQASAPARDGRQERQHAESRQDRQNGERHRPEYRSDHRGDSKSERRADSRPDHRLEHRSDGQSEHRADGRFDHRHKDGRGKGERQNGEKKRAPKENKALQDK